MQWISCGTPLPLSPSVLATALCFPHFPFIPWLSTSARTWRCPRGGRTESPCPRCHRRHHTACPAGRGSLHTSGCILGVYPIMEIKTQATAFAGQRFGCKDLGTTPPFFWGLAWIRMSFKATPGESPCLSVTPVRKSSFVLDAYKGPTVPLRDSWKREWVLWALSDSRRNYFVLLWAGLGVWRISIPPNARPNSSNLLKTS